MSATVNFQNIPPGLQVPLFWVETSNSQAGVNLQQQRVLIVGATLNTMPLAPVWAPPPAGGGARAAEQAVAAQTGSGSMVSGTVGAYRTNDAFTEVWFLPVADPGGGTAATAQLAFSGTATAPGTLAIYLDGVLIQQAVTVGETAVNVGLSLIGAFAALQQSPVTISVNNGTGTATIATKHRGIVQNGHDLRINYGGAPNGEATPPGITVSVTNFSGGTGVPDLSGVAAALGTMEFDFIICGFTDSASRAALTAIMADQAGRWSYVNQLYGGTFVADVDTPTNLLTLGGSENDQHMCVIGATGSPTPPWKVAAYVMGVAVPRIIAQPNIPLDGLVVPGVLPPSSSSLGYSVSTKQSLLTTGISPLEFDRTGACHIVRLISAYQTNTFGSPDQSYFDIGVLYTIMAVLRRLKANTTQRLAQKLLVDDDTPIGAGQPAISPRVERMNLYHDYLVMESELLVENADAFLAGLVVTRNADNPTRLDVLYDPHIVSGLHIYAVLNQFYLRAAA